MKKYWPKIRRMFKELLVLPFAANTRTCLAFYGAIITSIPSIIRNRNFGAPHSKMWGRPCTFKFLGQKIRMDGITFGYAGEIYVRKCYTRRFPIKAGDTVIDLGASMGVFSVAAALVSGKKVLAVDVEPKFLKLLEEQARMNDCLNKIDIVLGAVGSGTGTSVSEMAKVPALDMGRLLDERGIDTVDFLKVDIEGSEFDLFRHPEGWLDRVRQIAMEVHPVCGDAREIKAILERAGFQCVLQDLDGRTAAKISGEPGYLFASRQ